MSDLRPSCFWGRITWPEWESLVFGIGWLIIHIARATFPIFFTCCGEEKIAFSIGRSHNDLCLLGGVILELTLSGRYEGSQTTFLHFAVSPSEVTPMAFPFSSNSTWMRLNVSVQLPEAILVKLNHLSFHCNHVTWFLVERMNNW